MTRTHTLDLPALLVRAAGALVVTLMSTGAGCDPGTGGGTGDFSTGDFETSTGDPSTTMTPTTTTPTTDPSTTTPTTTSASTTMTTADPTTDSDPTDTDPTDTGDPACFDGSYIGVRVTRTDLYGHFPFLKLFYAPDAPDETVDEMFDVDVAPDGTITVTLLPRASGTGEGHTGLAGLTGTIDEACVVAIETQASFESDTGPFGDISVGIVGTADAMSMTLEGGGIPSGPITYEFTLTPE